MIKGTDEKGARVASGASGDVRGGCENADSRGVGKAAAAKAAVSAVASAVPGEESLEEFRARVFLAGRELYRDLPWRRTRDAYAIWVSEAMLQQTQVSRVDGRWQSWLEHFPSVDALAAASSADVLAEWQGLGYNRRALALWNAAREVSERHGGVMPVDEAELRALPGIGPATAAGIRAFAYDLPGVYLETNVRTVFLHELFPEADGVPDSALVPLVREACPGAGVQPACATDVAAGLSPKAGRSGAVGSDEVAVASKAPVAGETDIVGMSPSGPGIEIPGADVACTPRSWYYALLDYGAYLKRTVPNPSRRSRSNVRQSKFEGSHRQKRASVVRMLLAAGAAGLAAEDASLALSAEELAAGREPVSEAAAASILSELASEGFCHEDAPGLYLA